jgi:hypothetical protein
LSLNSLKRSMLPTDTEDTESTIGVIMLCIIFTIHREKKGYATYF